MSRLRCITVAVAMAGGLLAGAGSAGAAVLTCGTTIMVSTTLTADMTCPGDAIVIGAPGVVLDLGGHTLTGGGAGRDDEKAGVRVEAPAATVRNGRIRTFGYGIRLARGSDGALIHGLTLEGDRGGALVDSSSNRFRGNSLVRNGNGLLILGNGNVVEGNAFRANAQAIFVAAAGHTAVLGNDIVGDDGDDSGIVVTLPGVRIVGNRVSHYRGPAGINLFNSGEVSNNQVFANVDGIRVRGAASVTGNVVFSNADDGIDAGAGAVLQGNIVIQNADLGIEAGPGVIDAGGNRAFANGNPRQCVGVVCS